MGLLKNVAPGPWKVTLGGAGVGSARSRGTAMNLIDKPYRRGFAQVRHEKTGETWSRKAGSWFRETDPGARRDPAQEAPKPRVWWAE